MKLDRNRIKVHYLPKDSLGLHVAKGFHVGVKDMGAEWWACIGASALGEPTQEAALERLFKIMESATEQQKKLWKIEDLYV